MALLPQHILGTAFTTVVLAALGALWWPNLPGGDLLVRTVAWLGTVAIVWPRRDFAWRPVLLVAFGLGWAAWMLYHVAPGWVTWGAFQTVRAVSLGWFCWIVGRPAPVRVYERSVQT